MIALSFLSMTGFGSVLPALPLYLRAHGLPLSWLGLAAGGYAAGALVGQVPFGVLADRMGRRPLIVAGMLAGAVSFALFLLPLSPPLYILLRAVQGLSSAATGPATGAMVADLAPGEERGRAYGLLLSGTMGGFVAGPLLGGLAAAAGGLAATFVVGSLLSLAGFWLALTLPAAGRPAVPRAHSPRPGPGLHHLAARVWPLLLLNFGWMGLIGMYDTVWSVFLRALGASLALIGLSFAVFSAPMMVFAVLAGHAADRMRHKERALLLGAWLNVLVVVGYSLSRSLLAVLLLSVVEAVVMSLAPPILNALLADKAGEERYGEAQGLAQAAATAGSLLAATASGYLLSRGLAAPFWFGAGMLLLSLLGAWPALRRG